MLSGSKLASKQNQSFIAKFKVGVTCATLDQIWRYEGPEAAVVLLPRCLAAGNPIFRATSTTVQLNQIERALASIRVELTEEHEGLSVALTDFSTVQTGAAGSLSINNSAFDSFAA